jgi:mannose-6-phosphate isomerase-like protein (cupin superfamily)
MKYFHNIKDLPVMEAFLAVLTCEFKIHMNYVIEGSGALVNEKGEEQPLKAGDFALVNPDEKHQYRNKGDKPFKMICGVPKEFE